MLSVIDLSDMRVETPGTVAVRIRRALYQPREVACAKKQAMVQGAAI
jgi:hypothetical protein